MKNNKTQFLVLSFFLFALSVTGMNSASAQGVVGEKSGDRWRSSLFLYLWAINLDGTATVRGNSFTVDESFSDLVDDLAN